MSFLLENLDNYKKTISNNIDEIYSKYTEQIFDYIINILFIDIDNNNYTIKKGIEILTYIFKYIFLYTFNLELSIYHMKKAKVYYIEFVRQINTENNSFYKLKLKDSALFVYKKTIFDISKNYKSIYSINDDNHHKIEKINKLIDIFKLIINTNIDYLNFGILINDKNNDKNKEFNNISKNEEDNSITFEIDIIKNIIDKKINNNIINLLNLDFKEEKNNNSIYKWLEIILLLLNFIINNILNENNNNSITNTIDNDDVINIYKNKLDFLTNVMEIIIKFINKNYNNNNIDKIFIEKKINLFNVNDNKLDFDYKLNPSNFVNWIFNI